MRTLVLALTVLNVSADPQPGRDADAQQFARWEKEIAAYEASRPPAVARGMRSPRGRGVGRQSKVFSIRGGSRRPLVA